MAFARRPRWTWIAAGLLLGAVGFFVWAREPASTLTRDGLASARAVWEAAAPPSYRLEIETAGSMEARHRVEVRDGEVVSMTTGDAPATPSSWEYWSVEGLFGFLETELANAANPRTAYGVDPGEVVLRVRFDGELGYPAFFLRHVMGSQRSVEWRVVSFEAGD